MKRFVNICKINGCEKCKWRVDKAALQKILNRETEEKIEILKEEKCRLIKERQQGTKRFNFVVEQLKEKEEMKRPVKDRFEDADEDDQELVISKYHVSTPTPKSRVVFGTTDGTKFGYVLKTLATKSPLHQCFLVKTEDGNEIVCQPNELIQQWEFGGRTLHKQRCPSGSLHKDCWSAKQVIEVAYLLENKRNKRDKKQ